MHDAGVQDLAAATEDFRFNGYAAFFLLAIPISPSKPEPNSQRDGDSGYSNIEGFGVR